MITFIYEIAAMEKNIFFNKIICERSDVNALEWKIFITKNFK